MFKKTKCETNFFFFYKWRRSHIEMDCVIEKNSASFEALTMAVLPLTLRTGKWKFLSTGEKMMKEIY